MTFPHPLRGTCVPECPMYGFCHCNCGRTARWAAKSCRRWGIVGKRYMAFLRGHNPATIEAARSHHGIACSTVGVDSENVAGMIRDLLEQMSWHDAGKLLGMTPGQISRILRHTYRTVNPRTAARVRGAYDEAFGGQRWLATAPLRGRVEFREYSNLESLLRAYANRFNVNIRTANRHWEDLQKSELIREQVAEQWAVFLKIHPIGLWGWDNWFDGVVAEVA